MGGEKTPKQDDIHTLSYGVLQSFSYIPDKIIQNTMQGNPSEVTYI